MRRAEAISISPLMKTANRGANKTRRRRANPPRGGPGRSGRGGGEVNIKTRRVEEDGKKEGRIGKLRQ